MSAYVLEEQVKGEGGGGGAGSGVGAALQAAGKLHAGKEGWQKKEQVCVR